MIRTGASGHTQNESHASYRAFITTGFAASVRPFPVADLRHIVAVAGDVLFVLDELVAQKLLEVGAPALQPGHAVDHVAGQMEAVEIVQHRHVERRGRGAFLFISPHVQIVVIGAPISEAMDQPGIAVEREDDGLIRREERVEIPVRKP